MAGQPTATIPLTTLFSGSDGPRRHATNAELAASGPVHRVLLPSGKPAWLIIGYDEVRAALHDPRLVKHREVAQASLNRNQLPPEVFAAMTQHMLNRNPPDHARLRRLVTTAFTRRRVEELAPRIQQITDELLDALAGMVQADLLASFAYPLPITVICELLGIPELRRTEFRAWSTTLAAGMMADPDESATAAAAMVGYLRKLVAVKRADPADDLLSALVAVREGDDRLSEDELTSMGFLLLVAGYETTVNLLGNGVYALLTNPEQLAALRAEPRLLSAAVEELLRFDGPLQMATFRLTSEPVQIGGVTIPARQTVIADLLAANRDPKRFSHPEVLDLTRADNPHLAFGHGIHNCLGASLARLEGRIALGTLLTRFPRLRLAVPAQQLTWRPGLLMNGLTELPVAVD